MAKVIGFTKNGGEDWFTSSAYGNREIIGIPDPEGGHALNVPTAIPSPFARMDLVRKSFKNIVESPTLEFTIQSNKVIASKEDEKVVSQCLDLAELLFFYDTYKSKIEIVEWNKGAQLQKLKQSSNSGHKRLGEVLELYLHQDTRTFNFAEMGSVYLIKCNHQVIGGTSPLTLFFPTARNIEELSLKSSKGTTFFKDVVPLYKRDENFQKYLYLLFKNSPDLSGKMKDLQEYLSKSLEVLNKSNPQLYSELCTLSATEFDNYVNLNTKDAGQVVKVLGVSLKTINPDLIIDNIQKSNFLIHSSKYQSSSTPLALQNYFNEPLHYVTAKWDSRTIVPYVDNHSFKLRKLPGLDITYPYLTVSDFLEPDIIRLVYPINKSKYFDGNLKFKNPEITKNVLLPLKPLFFDFFDVEDLMNGGVGKPQISMDESVGDSVRVLLKIPINNGKDHVVFERIYLNEDTSDLNQNKGAIKEHQFGVTIFPFLKHADGIDPFYKIQVVDRDVMSKVADANYSLNFFQNGSSKPIETEFENSRDKKKKGDVSKVGTKYYSLNKGFDYIQVDNNFAKGLIIPKWETSLNNGDQFTFAVDFGTTNTHIEYSVNNGAPRPFEINENDVQAVPLFNSNIKEHNFSGSGSIDISTTIKREFVPELITKDTLYNFPQRTVISQSKTNAPIIGGNTLLDYNIPFSFDNNIDNNSKYFTNLKWNSIQDGNELRVYSFLEQLILLIRNKVLLNGGDIHLTKIIWTYPTSMSPARKNNLQNIWNEFSNKYFNSDAEPVDICESIAPYYYFQDNGQLEGLGYGISLLMDIGGGTSDVVVFENNIPKLISSYKFAGNTLFGDGYKQFENIKNNELINKYKDEFNLLLSEENPTLADIAEKLYSTQNSADYNAFLFSLANNLEIKNKKQFDYNKKLASDQDLKIVFLYFYAAKVYHIAKLMNANSLVMPTNLIFSGNGAKIIKIISPNKKLITEITKLIFGKVYNLNHYPTGGLKVSVENEFPKAVTCKGSLIHSKMSVDGYEVDKLKKILTCLEVEGIFNLKNSDVTEEVIEKVAFEVQQFNDMFVSLNAEINFENYFEVTLDAFNQFKRLINQHTKSFLKAGIEFNERMDGYTVQPSSAISETLFFYPIVQTIQELIKELAVLKTNMV